MRLRLLLISMLIFSSGCSANENVVDPCPPDLAAAQLCIVSPGQARSVERLASIDVGDPGNNIKPSLDDPFERLTNVALSSGDTLTVAIGPSATMTLVEISVYSSIDALAEASPIMTVECVAVGCSRWDRSVLRDGWAIQIPFEDLSIGNVLIASAFVAGPTQTGMIPWGLVVGESP